MKDSFHKNNEISEFQIPVAPDKLRILLWDIDGTLMRSKVRGSYKKYFAATMNEVFGSAGKLDEITPSGMTDTQIILEALKDQGFTAEDIHAEQANLLKTFEKEMSRVISAEEKHFTVFPGASEILEKTEKNPRYINSILTGNLSCAAEIKLTNAGLWKYFKDVPKICGEISHDRRELAREAGQVFNNYLNTKLKPEQFIVFGDTPNDITCARAFGAKIISVATGRNHPVEELSKHEPDFVLNNLEDTDEILSILDSL